MPIKTVALQSEALDLNRDDADALIEEEFSTEDILVTLITAFLRLNSAPTDDQVHDLASALGLSKENLEQQIYALSADLLSDDGEELVATAEFDLDVAADLEVEELTEEDTGELNDPEMEQVGTYEGAPKDDDEAVTFDGTPDLDTIGPLDRSHPQA